MKLKSEAPRLLIKCIAFVKRATGNDVRIVRSDGGGEFDNNVINEFYDS